MASNVKKFIPFTLLLMLTFLSQLSATPSAWWLATSSGAIRSGLGMASAMQH
jgi:hypothetical protein